jgi:DNA-binding LacI/PurR family transcriptional regulator
MGGAAGPAIHTAHRQGSSGAPTMKEIAIAAGVSQSTVSRVLSRGAWTTRISAPTRERVIAVARDYGYQPNPLARGLRGAPTMLLGVIVGDITDPFFPGVIEAVSAAARSRGYNVVLGHARGSAREAVALRAVLETRHCDAIIILGDMREHPRVLAELAETGVPAVSLGRGSQHSSGVTIDVDNRTGIWALMDHLTGLGHQRIGYVGARSYGDFPARREAYHEYMRAHDLPVLRGYEQRTVNSAAAGADALRSVLALRTRPTAVVLATDLLAVGALLAAHQAGLVVPRDISVTGFDDLPIAGYTVPPLTTVRTPSAEMSAAAVEAAIALVDDRAADLSAHLFPPVLVIRESTAPPGGRTGSASADDNPAADAGGPHPQRSREP